MRTVPSASDAIERDACTVCRVEIAGGEWAVPVDDDEAAWVHESCAAYWCHCGQLASDDCPECQYCPRDESCG